MLRRCARLEKLPGKLCFQFSTRTRRKTLDIEDLRRQIQDMPQENQAEILKHVEKFKNEKTPRSADDEFSQSATLVASFLSNSRSSNDFDLVFWKNVRHLAKSNDPRLNELFIRLFDAAKVVPNTDLRLQAIVLVGNFIYRQKQFRFDPVNEIEYLNSLMILNKHSLALKYWKTRVGRDDVKSGFYWREMGALFHLEAQRLQEGNRLALEMQNEGYIPPRVLVMLVRQLSRCPTHYSELDHWVQVLCHSIPNIGKESQAEISPDMDALVFMNQRQTLQWSHVDQILIRLIRTRNWTLSTNLLRHIPRKFLGVDSVIRAFLLPRSQYNFRIRDKEASNFVSALIEKEPSVILEGNLYIGWISELLRLGISNDVESMYDLMKLKNIKLSESQASRLVIELLKHKRLEFAQRVNQDHDYACVAVPMLRYLHKYEPSKVDEYIESINCDLDPSLALEISAVGNTSNIPLEFLGATHDCWRNIWSLAVPGVGSDPRSMFATMASTGIFNPASVGLLKSVVRLFLSTKDYVGLCAVSLFLFSEHHVGIPKVLSQWVTRALSSPNSTRELFQAEKPNRVDLVLPKKLLEQGAPEHFIQKVAQLTSLDAEDLKTKASILAVEWADLAKQSQK